MKINLEIKGTTFFYNYQVGDSECGGKTNMNADILTLFSKCLEMCIHHYSTTTRARKQKLDEKILEVAEKWAKDAR